jgi:hypothetical protein
MGWNPAHNLDADDWNELRGAGIANLVQSHMNDAKAIAQHCELSELSIPLTKLLQSLSSTRSLDAPTRAGALVAKMKVD